MSQHSPQPPSNPTDSEPVRTRSGRVTKPPVRYEPVEQVEDDYAPEDYDSDESDVESVCLMMNPKLKKKEMMIWMDL
jgi:hypothetical protein